MSQKLEALLEGKPARESITVVDAVAKWLEFREQNGDGNTKADLMGRRLIDWCEKNGVVMMTAITTEQAIDFRVSLPFRTKDSSSLAVHWSVINQFFNWCEGKGYIERNPCPNPKLLPQFRIKYDKPEVVPPTKKQMEKILVLASDRVRLLCELMRWSGMALVDAQKFDPANLQDGTFIRGNRTKTKERYRVRIPQQLANQLEALGTPAFPGTYREWRERVDKVVKSYWQKTHAPLLPALPHQ